MITKRVYLFGKKLWESEFVSEASGFGNIWYTWPNLHRVTDLSDKLADCFRRAQRDGETGKRTYTMNEI
jgi:hypothetical protein